MDWDFQPPTDSELIDREVRITGSHLEGKRIALLITGSIAAYRCPDLVRDLRREGAEVQVFATREGLRYVSREALEWNSLNPVIDQFSSEAEHLSDNTPTDAYLVAPASYSVINKAVLGIADSVVSSAIAAALGRMERKDVPLLFAPAMHGAMHNSILTDNLRKLHEMGAEIIPPRQSHGKNNLASADTMVAATIRALNRTRLKDQGLLITGGPTPVPVDHIRHITSRFTGGLAIEIAREAWFRGASVHLLLGRGSLAPPEFLAVARAADYEEYRTELERILGEKTIDWGIFSAAVADYQPESVYEGKLPSGKNELPLTLRPTVKVIEEIHVKYPELNMIPFKYEENVSHEELMSIAATRLNNGDYPMIVANRKEDFIEEGEQVAWLVAGDQEPRRVVGKPGIARALLDWIESVQ